MDDNKNLKMVSKGWILKNFLMGGGLLVSGCILFVADIYASSESGSPGVLLWINSIGYLSLAIVFVGIFGYWLVVPAFQKWRHTKYEWLAWIFLAVVILIAYIVVHSFLYL